MIDSLQTAYRGLMTGLIVADYWSNQAVAPQDLGSPQPGWQIAFQELLDTLEPRDPASPGRQTIDWPGLEAEDPTSLLLATLPRLLLQINRYGHGHSAIQIWAQDLGLEPTTVAAITQLFQRLCQGLFPSLTQASCGLSSFTARGEPPAQVTDGDLSAQSLSQASPLANLETAADIVQSCRGQYAPSLLVSAAQHQTAATVTLVGLLASLNGGWSTIPLAWRFSSSQASRALHYGGVRDEPSIWILADRIFYRWAGRLPPARSNGRETFVALG